MPRAVCSASSQHDLLLPAGSPSQGSTQARRRLQVALQRLAERNQWPMDGDSDDPRSPTSEWGFPVTRWGRCCLASSALHTSTSCLMVQAPVYSTTHEVIYSSWLQSLL